MSARVLVIGASGYIGGRLVRSLAGRPGTEVRAGVPEPVPWLATVDQVLVGPESDEETLAAAVAGADAVVHLGVPNEVVMAARPDECLAEATTFAARLARACRGAGTPRLVYISTIHVYGGTLVPGAEVDEGTTPEPRDAYAIARLASEHLVRSLAPSAVVLRFTNVVGAPIDASVDRWSLVANDLCRQGVEEGVLELRSDGLQTRDFLAMDEACRVLTAAAGIDAGRTPAIAPGLYNVASGRPRTIRWLAEQVQLAVERRTGARPPIVAPPPAAEPPAPWRVSPARLAGAGIELAHEIDGALDETVDLCLGAGRDADERGMRWATSPA